MQIAIPTNSPGGLQAQRSDHFGHCDIFTVVEFDEQKSVKNVTTIANGGHEAGGCLVPVQLLHAAGVQAIIVGGMGGRPLRGFAEVGITVYFADRGSMQTVSDVVDGFVANSLPVMHADQACQGSGNCQH